MTSPQDIIIKPVITEKSMNGIANRKYTFKVAKNATKNEIAKAVEKLFNVEVAKVHTMNVIGRSKRINFKMPMGKKPDWKKAIVTITEKSKTIEFFESMV